MAIQTMTLDPDAQSYTDDEIVGKVNTATANISRASSVTAAARPLEADEVTDTEINDGAIKTKLGAEADGDKLVAASLASSAAIVGTQLSASAAIAGSQLSATAGIAGTQLDASANIAGSQLDAAADIAGSQLASDAAIAGTQLAAAADIAGTQLDSTAAKDNLDALSDTDRAYIKTAPETGQFKVISVQRASDGKAEMDYDDVAV